MAACIKLVSDISGADIKLFGSEPVLLAEMKNAGLPVQNFFVISSAAQAQFNRQKNFSDDFKEELESAYSLFGFDAHGQKAADALLTRNDLFVSVWPVKQPAAKKLNVRGFTNLMQAVRDILGKYKSAVVVQQQINPEKSGIAIIKGGELKVVAALGFYVRGIDKNCMVVQDEFGNLIKKNVPDSLNAKPIVSDAEHELIGRLAKKSAIIAGRPVSVEWCAAGNTFYVNNVSVSEPEIDCAEGFAFLENGPKPASSLIDGLMELFDGLSLRGKPKEPKASEDASYLDTFFNKIVAPITNMVSRGAARSDVATEFDEICATSLQALVTNAKAPSAENAILDLSELGKTESPSEYENIIFEKGSSIKNPWIKISSPLDKESAEIFSAEVRALKRLADNDSELGILLSGITTINGLKKAKEILRQAGLSARVGMEFDNMNSVMIADVLCKLSDFATASVKKLQQHISGRPLLRALQDIQRSAKVAGIPFSLVMHSPDKSLTDFLVKERFESIAVPDKISDLIKSHVLAAEKKLLLSKNF